MDRLWRDAAADVGQAVQDCYYINPPANCDLCERPFEQDYFVDGRIKGLGVCGFMCVGCFAEHGAGLGPGIGQLFKRESDQRWRLVAGRPG